jgi:branched-chain amino acid transport system ATP-binding protein
MLEIRDLTKQFGGLSAISNLNITVNKGEYLGLIGPNGAGKTTLFNLITGFLHPTKGSLNFEGKNITNNSPHKIAGLGIVRTFQANNLFPDYTVLENVSLSCHLHARINWLESVLRTRRNARKEKDILQRCRTILDSVGMSGFTQVQAGSLAHGYKRLLGIAIALAAEPKLLLLDEPLSGMNPVEVNETLKVIDKLWKSGVTVLLIEHNMRATMSVCQRIVVINFGRKIAEGSPEEIKNNEAVIQAYLGVRE